MTGLLETVLQVGSVPRRPVTADDLVPDLSRRAGCVPEAADSGLAAIGTDVLADMDLLDPAVGELVDDVRSAHSVMSPQVRLTISA